MIRTTLGHIATGVAVLPNKYWGFRFPHPWFVPPSSGCPPVGATLGCGVHTRGVHTTGRCGVCFLAHWQASDDTRCLSESFHRSGPSGENL